MKYSLALLFFLAHIASTFAQYDKNKLTGIVTGGSSKSWSVKGINIERPEKKITFNINMHAEVEKENGKGGVEKQVEKWNITSKDNIRWFISVGSQSYELIVSYSKNGNQYLKLAHKTGNDIYELNLLPL